jgi:hypothetical protein
MSHTVILRWQGIDRTYHCANYYDAVMLRDALETRYGPEVVELWEGMTRL